MWTGFGNIRPFENHIAGYRHSPVDGRAEIRRLDPNTGKTGAQCGILDEQGRKYDWDVS